LTSEAFDPPPAALPPNVRYVGPQLDGSSSGRLDLSWPTLERERLVVVSFSTRFAAAGIVQQVLDALATLRVRVLLTLGLTLEPEDLRIPANALVSNFVPHRAVLPFAQLVITHAGLGTVMAALVHGVPLVCIPLKNDQFENAARVVAAEAGRTLNRKTTRHLLRRAILQVLNEPRFRAGARRMADAIAADDTSAVEELEALVGPSHAGASCSRPFVPEKAL
jgi:MGT family glycosyltransferase